MPTYIYNKILERPQLVPIFIPDPATVRAFVRGQGELWTEIDRVDLTDMRSVSSYTYDDKINVYLFHPLMVGIEVQIQYDHSNVPNPGVVDLLPNIVAQQARYDFNRVLSGLYVDMVYKDGVFTAWKGKNIILTGGIVRLNGYLYTVGTSDWPITELHPSMRPNTVQASMFYVYEGQLSQKAKDLSFIETPGIIRSKTFELGLDGAGISDALSDINWNIRNLLNSMDMNGFVELIRTIVIPGVGDSEPQVNFYYDPQFRVRPDF